MLKDLIRHPVLNLFLQIECLDIKRVKRKITRINKKKFPYKLVLIAWEDIVSNSDWENINKIKKAKTAVCYSVGWLMAETSKITVIMSDLSFEDNHEIEQGGSYTTIPTKNVLSIKNIKL